MVFVKTFISTFILLCGGFIASSYAESKQPSLKIYTEHFPPYNYLADGKVVGINVELVQYLCDKSDVSCQFELLPWTRAFKLAQKNANSGVISTSRNKAREHSFQWVGPLAFSKAFFYKLKARDDIQLTSMTQALNYTVGIQRSDIYEKMLLENGFTKGLNLLEVSSKHEDINLFFMGKLDLIIGSELTLPYQVKDAGYSTSTVTEALELPLLKLEGNFLAINLQTSPELVKQLQQQLQLLKEQGGIQRFIDKYKAPR